MRKINELGDEAREEIKFILVEFLQQKYPDFKGLMDELCDEGKKSHYGLLAVSRRKKRKSCLKYKLIMRRKAFMNLPSGFSESRNWEPKIEKNYLAS